jgi:predicted cupin superfamily sugar epimerase
MPATAQYWIDHLNLQPHPEGGYYKEVFRSVNEVMRNGSDGSETGLHIHLLPVGR